MATSASVSPPHCEDALSWQLLANSHAKMLNVKDALLCQQRVVMVQTGRPVPGYSSAIPVQGTEVQSLALLFIRLMVSTLHIVCA